jgi:hypothetical protein
VSRRDCDAAVVLFRRLVDLVESQGFSAVQLRHHFCERRRQRRFAMVYVTDGADVEVRFVSLELLFLNDGNLLWALGKRKKPPPAEPKGAFGCSRSPLTGAQTLGNTLPSRLGQV